MDALLTQDRSGSEAGLAPAFASARDSVTVCMLPLGYIDAAGVCHREVELKPLTGHEQRLLLSFPSQTPVSVITTALLTRCVVRLGGLRSVSSSLVRDLLVGDREFLVLKLFEITFANRLFVELYCPVENCGEALEFPISLEQCGIEARALGSRTFFFKPRGEEKRKLEFRLPTGGDQEYLAVQQNQNDLEGRLHTLCCLQSSARDVQRLSEKDRLRLDKQMHRLAPTMEVEVEITCAKCSQLFSARVDAPFLALSDMRVNENELDWEVHCLAFHYNWSESEILSLTPKRRRRYLDLLHQGLERVGTV